MTWSKRRGEVCVLCRRQTWLVCPGSGVTGPKAGDYRTHLRNYYRVVHQNGRKQGLCQLVFRRDSR
jgi:hypothetical protein